MFYKKKIIYNNGQVKFRCKPKYKAFYLNNPIVSKDIIKDPIIPTGVKIIAYVIRALFIWAHFILYLLFRFYDEFDSEIKMNEYISEYLEEIEEHRRFKRKLRETKKGNRIKQKIKL